MLKPAQLSGYLLEEVVAHLLRSSGYRLLVEADDSDVLVWRGNGLRVRGRGAEHQADTLGELSITIPFSLPIRLFVEAKNTKDKVGLDVLRNAHGVIYDVNEFVRTSTDQVTEPHHLRRVQYRYSIFSTGGFTKDAQQYALAHQISLIDLSGPAWGALARKLRRAATGVLQVVAQADAGAVARLALRQALSQIEPSLSDEVGAHLIDAPPEVDDWARGLAASILRSTAGDEDILLGFVDAPFVLALRPQDTDAFREHVTARAGPIWVHIAYDHRGPIGGDWVVQDADQPEAFLLTFALPGVLEELLLATPAEDVRQQASRAKNLLMSTITVYIEGAPVTLVYRRVQAPRTDVLAEDARDTTELRKLLRPLTGMQVPKVPSEPPVEVEASAPWTPSAVAELMHRLDARGYVQADLIRRAARQGGTITRREIYEEAGFSEERTLRGLARPPNRIRQQLIDEGQLPTNAGYPFEAAYASGVMASDYQVPEDIVAILQSRGKM